MTTENQDVQPSKFVNILNTTKSLAGGLLMCYLLSYGLIRILHDFDVLGFQTELLKKNEAFHQFLIGLYTPILMLLFYLSGR